MGLAAVNALDLARHLIRRPSVTPEDAGALDILEEVLTAIGFRCQRLRFQEDGTPDVDNLYARFGDSSPNFCFAGHTDVVPVGDHKAWSVDPFAAELSNGLLIGRGASDMKSAIAAFAAAAAAFIAAEGGGLDGSISFLITGDEEGPAINGTVKVLEWLENRGERLDACVVGEPTNPEQLGDMIKIGRRGSLTGRLKVLGRQGHIAYPHLADNPMPRLLAALTALDGRVLDTGNAHFQASNLEITTIDCGNPATNVIAAAVSASFNIRFNTEQTAAALAAWIEEVCEREAGAHELSIDHGSDPFLTEPGAFTDLVRAAVQSVTGRPVELSTTGGTSDARFIKDYCPVVEFGLVGQTMHKVDEHCRVDDIEALATIYRSVLERFFSN